MVLLNSEKIELTTAPSFSLPSVDGKNFSLHDFQSKKVLILMFICNHCPYVRAIEDRIIALQREFASESVQLVGICSNDAVNYPDDSPAKLKERWLEMKYDFPYLIDEDQSVAKAYGAVCTPDLYVFDEDRQLAYHGRLDDSWKDPEKVSKRDLADAVRLLLTGKSVPAEQYSSMGCSIKWKK